MYHMVRRTEKQNIDGARRTLSHLLRAEKALATTEGVADIRELRRIIEQVKIFLTMEGAV